MKKKLLILLLCLLVVSQLAFAKKDQKTTNTNFIYNVSVGVTLGEIDNNIKLTRFTTRGNYSFTFSKETNNVGNSLGVGTNLAYSHIINPDGYVEGKANRFQGASYVEFKPTIKTLKPTFRAQFGYDYVDASKIDSDTGEITAPGWYYTVEDTFTTNNINSNKTTHNLLFGASYALNKRNDRSTLSHFGRYNLEVKERYMATATLRYDSAFIDNQKYSGLFPSVSFGWVASEEQWFEDKFKDVNFLKFRYSWGRNGNSTVISDGTSSDWEVSTQFDAGVDARFMNNTIGIAEDIFVNKTENDVERILLYGNELSVNANKRFSKDFNYASNFNSSITFEKTEDGSELYASNFSATFNASEKEFDSTAYFSYAYNRDFDIEDNEYEKQITANIITGYTGKDENNDRFRFASIINVDMVLIDGAYAPDVSFSTTLDYNKRAKINESFALVSSFLLINNSERATSPINIRIDNSVSGSISAKQP